MLFGNTVIDLLHSGLGNAWILLWTNRAAPNGMIELLHYSRSAGTEFSTRSLLRMARGCSESQRLVHTAYKTVICFCI